MFTIGTYEIVWALGLLCVYSLLRPKFARIMYHMILEILRLIISMYVLYFVITVNLRHT